MERNSDSGMRLWHCDAIIPLSLLLLQLPYQELIVARRQGYSTCLLDNVPHANTTGGTVRGDAARVTCAGAAPAHGSPRGDDYSGTAAGTCRADASGHCASCCYGRNATGPGHICAPEK